MTRLASLPRRRLAELPTPLHSAPRLSEELGVEVWVKRDDLTGVGVGGNKVRALEYLFGAALAQGCDVFLTAAGEASNYAALAALAGARAGLEVHLVRYGEPSAGVGGNLELVELSGARCHYTGDPDRSSVDAGLELLAAELERKGRRPYVAGRGGATPVGCLGYARAGLELAGQLVEAGIEPTRVLVATGSCGTQAGLEAGRRWLRGTYRVVGVAVSRPLAETERRVAALAAACGELLGLGSEPGEAPVVLDGYRGPGYGLPSEPGRAAMAVAARREGLVLDPVFTAKAFAALLDTAAQDAGPVVFWHTGGAANTLDPTPAGSL